MARWVLSIASALIALSALACVSPRSGLGGQCDLSSECESPLICRFERCRRECNETRDCPPGLACVLDRDKQGACLIPEETRCATAAECPDPLVCSFGRCTNRCEGDRDCVSPQRCEEDPSSDCSEGSVSCVTACFVSEVVETPCLLDSHCEGNQRCYPDGRCRPRCAVDRDCNAGEICEVVVADVRDNRCVPRAMDGGADGGVDGALDAALDAMLDAADTAIDAADGGFDAGPVVDRPCALASECDANNATTDCVGGFCRVLSCDPGFADCDRDPLTGCHAPLDSWIACGSCSNPCGAGNTCAGTTCSSDAIAAVASGGSHTCILRSTGAVACWGLDIDGQLGDGAVTVPPSEGGAGTVGPAVVHPSVVPGLSNVVEVAAGAGHTCVRRVDGTVSCWGSNRSGEAGPAGSGSQQLTPVAVTGLSDVAEISLGDGFGCARLSSGQVRCWGSNFKGQLGNDTEVDSSAPVTVVDGVGSTAPLSSVRDIDAGAIHACAALMDGTVRCWGTRNRGELGDGGPTNFFLTGVPAPVTVVGLANAVEVAAGNHASCARIDDGSIQCWGTGSLLGDGMSTDRSLPAAVTGITTAVEVRSAGSHFCARLSAGGVRCWGRSQYGAVGDGTGITAHSTPAAVVGLTDAAQIAPGLAHTCALRDTGDVACWGSNAFGEIGDNTRGCCMYSEGSYCFSGCGVTSPQPAGAL